MCGEFIKNVLYFCVVSFYKWYLGTTFSFFQLAFPLEMWKSTSRTNSEFEDLLKTVFWIVVSFSFQDDIFEQALECIFIQNTSSASLNQQNQQFVLCSRWYFHPSLISHEANWQKSHYQPHLHFYSWRNPREKSPFALLPFNCEFIFFSRRCNVKS